MLEKKISFVLQKEQAEEFLKNAKQDPEWVQNSLIQFVSYHNERAKRGEISVSTIPNYYRATKLFCEMNDIVLGWKNAAEAKATYANAVARTDHAIAAVAFAIYAVAYTIVMPLYV